MHPGLRLQRERSVLLVIDVQARLAPHVADGDALTTRIEGLIASARRFGVPCLLTEHCPGDLGPVVPVLRERFAAGEIFAKTRFGAADHPEFVRMLRATGRDQVVVAGMEGHVCVLQTTLGLIEHGFAVYPVADAIGSRPVRAADRALALERLQRAGATLLGTETVLFEWTHDGRDPAFRETLAVVKKLP